MVHFVGLDVSIATTAICIIDEKGEIASETVVESHPDFICGALRGNGRRYGRVILEAGPLCQWLFKGLAGRGLPVVCVEARHASAVLKTRPNKTDRNDARGLAEMARQGHFRSVHIKTDKSLQVRALLAARRMVLRKLVDLESSIRGILNPFGVKLGPARRKSFAEHVASQLTGQPKLYELVAPLLTLRDVLLSTAADYQARMEDEAEHDPVCRRLMTAPGVGPLVALTYRAAVDIPERFVHSRDVGPHLGLTPRTQQSGVTAWRSRISKCGDAEARRALFAAARAMLPAHRRPCELQSWGQAIRARAGAMKATVAVARRLAVILHRMWTDGTDFRWPAPAV